MSRIKEDRNIDIAIKKKAGWSYRKLAAHFNLSAPRIVQICNVNIDRVKGVHKRGLDIGVNSIKIK